MYPRNTRARWAVPLLFAGLGTAADGSFQSGPVPPHRPQERPSELRVTLQTEGPTFCREGQWVLSASIEGGTPERVELLTNGETTTTLEAPYRHVVDCAAHTEGRFAFVVRAMAGKRAFDTGEVSVTVDRTPPTLLATRPSHSYPSVSSPIAFVFSEPLLPDSLQSEPAELQEHVLGNHPVSRAHQAVLTEGGTVLELVPETPLQPHLNLRATLLQRSMTDLAGNPLDPSLPEFAFMHFASYSPFVGVAEPLFPEWVDPMPASFALVRDASGTAPVVGYTDYRNLGDHEPIVKQWDGQAWQRLPPLRAEHERSRTIGAFEIAGRDGVLVAHWFERNTTTGMTILRVATYTGTNWEHLPVPYDTPSQYPRVRMVLAPQGRPIIAVEGSTDTLEHEVRVIRWTGTEWQPLGEPLDGNPAPQTPARQVALATNGTRVVVSWEEATGGVDPRYSYIHARTFENGSWVPVGDPIPVRATVVLTDSTLSIQPDHRVVMAWIEDDFSLPYEYGRKLLIENLYFSSVSLDAAQPDWTPPERIGFGHSSGVYDAPRLIVGRDLEPWLLWNERSRYTLSARSYLSRLRATGAEPKQLIAEQPLFGIQLDEDGNPWALLGDTVVRPQ